MTPPHHKKRKSRAKKQKEREDNADDGAGRKKAIVPKVVPINSVGTERARYTSGNVARVTDVPPANSASNRFSVKNFWSTYGETDMTDPTDSRSSESHPSQITTKKLTLLHLPLPAIDTIIFFLTPPPNAAHPRDGPFSRTPWSSDLASLSATCGFLREEIWRRKIRVVRMSVEDCRHGVNLLSLMIPLQARKHIRLVVIR